MAVLAAELVPLLRQAYSVRTCTVLYCPTENTKTSHKPERAYSHSIEVGTLDWTFVSRGLLGSGRINIGLVTSSSFSFARALLCIFPRLPLVPRELKQCSRCATRSAKRKHGRRTARRQYLVKRRGMTTRVTNRSLMLN